MASASSGMASADLVRVCDVERHDEVYEPCDDSFALADALHSERDSLTLLPLPILCLEIGCGSGYISASLGKILGGRPAFVLATDINPNAAESTASALSKHGVLGDVVITDVASGLEKFLERSVGVLVCNPPYVPTPDEEVGVPGITSAWAGGIHGTRVIDRILPVAVRLLSSHGCFYLVTVSENNPEKIRLEMKCRGFDSIVVMTRKTVEESLFVIKFWKEKA